NSHTHRRTVHGSTPNLHAIPTRRSSDLASTTYDASAHTATGTATGVDVGGAALGTSFTLSGTTHTNAGTYNKDAWSFSGGTNYNDDSGTLDNSIAKTTAKVTVTPYTSAS